MTHPALKWERQRIRHHGNGKGQSDVRRLALPGSPLLFNIAHFEKVIDGTRRNAAAASPDAAISRARVRECARSAEIWRQRLPRAPRNSPAPEPGWLSAGLSPRLDRQVKRTE